MTYLVIQRYVTRFNISAINRSWDYLVSQDVKCVSSPYLNTNMTMMIVCHILNKNNVSLTDEDQYEGPGKARVPKYD